MKVQPDENGLTATGMTSEQLAGIEGQLQANRIDYNKDIDYDAMDYVLTVTYDDMYKNVQQVSGPFYQARSHTR